MSEIVIRPLDIARDCEGVAALFNASDLSWPGGWTHGIPLTASGVRQWLEEERNLVVFVAEADDQIVGYCSFMENTPWPSGLAGVGYLDLLNVHPAYHGRSIGRRLLQATIERAVQQGWQRQTLGTWSANFKSVPAYKRTGHFWRPDTSVWMENFIPGALQMPLAKPFFARHDWYASYVRKIEQAPDDERWEGLKVYTQRWQADGESLTIWIDREALAPCAIETDELLVAAIAQELEPLQGTLAAIRWRVHNKREAPLHVHIHALGADGLEIDHREGFVVPPGLSVEHVAQVEVTDKAPHAKPDGAAPAVRSIVTLDHDEVELFSGMRARAPLSLSSEPAQVTLWPNRPATLALALHSELDVPCSGLLHLIPSDGLQVEWRQQEVTLAPRGYLRLPVSVQAARPGVYSLHVRVLPEGDAPRPLQEELTLFCLEVGSVLGHQSGESVRLESEAVRVTVEARNGIVRLQHKEAQLELLTVRPYLGPPYVPGDFDQNHFSLRLEMHEGKAVVHMAAAPGYHLSTRLLQEVSLTPSGLVTLEQQLENLGAEPFDGCVVLTADWRDESRAMLTTPLHAGYVQAPATQYPKHGDDAPPEPAAYAEPWIAIEQRGVAAGVAWGPHVARLQHAWRLWLYSQTLHLAAGERSAAMRYALWAGSGDWRAAREPLLRWAGRSARNEEPPALEARPVARARLERPVLATVEDTVAADLLVDSVSVRRLDGEVCLEGHGVVAAPPVVPVRGLWRESPLRQTVTLGAPRGVGRLEGRVRLALPTVEGETPFEVLRLGHTHEVAVSAGREHGQPVWAIDNGLTRLTVAPTFGPSAISWLWQGEEMLESPFPEPRAYSWEYPWYGGIQLRLRMSDDQEGCGCLVEDAFAAEPVTVPDSQGLPWRGVRLRTRPQRKELHDLLVSFDYLTLGESPVLKLVYRLENLRATQQQVRVGGVAALRLGASLEQLILRGEHVHYAPEPWSTWHSHNVWGVLTDPQTGRSALAVCPQGRLALVNNGQSGRLLELVDQPIIQGGATYETVLYLALAESPEQAAAFRGLARV